MTVKLYVPTVLGMPAKSPFAFNGIPGGVVPAVMLQLYGVVPPVALKTSLYVSPCWPWGRLPVVIFSDWLLTGSRVTAAVADFVESALLVAVTTALVCAVTVGAVKRPLASIAPAVADQFTPVVAVPLTVAVNCCF